MNCEEFFDLSEGKAGLDPRGTALRVKPRDLSLDDFALVRADLRVKDPIAFLYASGRKPCDVIGTTLATVKLVSQRFIAILEENQFTGWTTFPVKVSLKDLSELSGYRGLAITGRCGPVDDSLSEKITQPPPVPGGRSVRALRGICFRSETWDGKDLFTPEGYASIFVIERVKNILTQEGVTNASFERLSEIERVWKADGSMVDQD